MYWRCIGGIGRCSGWWRQTEAHRWSIIADAHHVQNGRRHSFWEMSTKRNVDSNWWVTLPSQLGRGNEWCNPMLCTSISDNVTHRTQPSKGQTWSSRNPTTVGTFSNESRRQLFKNDAVYVSRVELIFTEVGPARTATGPYQPSLKVDCYLAIYWRVLLFHRRWIPRGSEKKGTARVLSQPHLLFAIAVTSIAIVFVVDFQVCEKFSHFQKWTNWLSCSLHQ